MLSRLLRLPLVQTAQRRSYRPLVGAAGLSGGALLAAGYVYADSQDDQISQPPLRELIRSYAVFTMCSIPQLVEHSPKILSVLTSVPGVRDITEAFVRTTFFGHVRVSVPSGPLDSQECSSLAVILRKALCPFYVPSAGPTKAPSSPTRSKSIPLLFLHIRVMKSLRINFRKSS